MSVLRSTAVAVLAAAATFASAQQPAPAEPPPPAPATSSPARRDQGLTFAVRGAWLKPHGIVAGVTGSDSELPLDREFASGAQLTLEAGWRFPIGLTTALFVQYGFVAPGRRAGNGLCETVSCDEGRTLKYGFEILYHFRRDRPVSPFVGAGLGRERSGYRATDPTGSATIRYEGLQWIDLQLGADWALAPPVFLGAFVSNSFGRYDTVSASGSGAIFTGDIAEKKVHSWLQVGVRLRWDLDV
jgi:hypothetical protein